MFFAKERMCTMMGNINHLVLCYGRFEQRVRQWTEKWCRPYCSVCRHVCCRAHYCLETRQSVFLERVAREFSSRSVFSDVHGWLGQAGCTLVAGRPPVCYEFLCRRIVDGVADDSLRHHALMVASMVMSHVGKEAISGRHVVEATRSADLERINPERFLTRLDHAEASFELAAALLEGRPATARSDVLSRIVLPPRKNKKTIRRLM
jgi:hypothetical protein